MTHPQISIAMATYNGGAYLNEQLMSLAVQHTLPLELVICDDGSSDETISIVEDFAKQAPFPVRLYRNKTRLGYGQNFMKAASLCVGPILAFCDQDDVWESGKLSELTQFFAHSDDLLVSHDFRVVFHDRRNVVPSYFDFLRRSGYTRAINVKGCSLAFKRELVDIIGWPPSNLAISHDVWVCFGALLLERKGYITEPLIRHRIHGENTSAWLVSGRTDWLRRIVRRLDIPPFVSAKDLDVFISQFVNARDLGLYRDVLERCASRMSTKQRRRALIGLNKRRTICDFLCSSDYGRTVRRIAAATVLFLRGTYAIAGGMPGLVQDLRGLRPHQS